jgi:SNF2 family DNA or RNA helicase
MLVLHAGIRDRELLLWGETPVGSAARSPPPRARGSKPGRAARLSYDAGSAALSAALAEVVPDLAQAESSGQRPMLPFTQAVMWLPTVAGEPVASSSLVAEPPPSRTEPTLTAWAVTVLHLSVEQSVALLCHCVGQDTLAPGVIVGQDLAFWTSALRFAGELVARQQFLPSVSQENGKYRACWKPVLAGPERERFSGLANAMPAAARALTLDAGAPPDVAATHVLSGFVDEIVDHLVRGPAASAMDSARAVPARPGRPRRAKPADRRTFDSVHDQWLSALRAPDGTMVGDARELARFAVQVREWQRPISAATTAPLRLCFRLDEPAADADGVDEGHGNDRIRFGRGAWRVQYLLQAADDPSLLVPADEAWRARGHQAAVLRRPGFNAKEYLLRALGQASGLCPRIEASLKTPAPSGYELDATGAHEFLTEKAAALEQTGFGVLLPAWWTRKGTKLRLTARANVRSPTGSVGVSPAMRGAGLTLDTVVQFNWEVALGGETLSLAELQALAKLKAPLVRLRGQWVQVSAAEIQAALDFWKHKSTGQATAREIVQMALGAARTAAPVSLDGVAADGWLGELLAQLDGRAQFGEVSVPDRFHGTLRPYQVRGYSWLCFLRQWGLGACLADDMGLGKTPQTLALIQRDWQAGAAIRNGQRPVLLVCPTSVVGNWQKEAARFTPDLPVMVHHGVTRTKGAAFKKQAAEHALVISSYALLHRDFEILKTVRWAGVVLDEAQNIKNPETKQARAARGLAADVRIALTGTPVENNVGDLWSIMEFLNPGLLGTQAEFKRTFFIPIQAGRDPEAVQRLKRITGPFLLRRLKTDKSIIADLPDKLEMKVFCTLTKEQASLYAAVVQEAEAAIEGAAGIQRKGVILATLSKLKQVCNHPAQFLGDNSAIPGRSGKLARLTEMLEEVLAIGDRALVFSQFSEMGALLRRHLEETFGREVLFLHGGVPKKQRDRMVERFQAGGAGDSGGAGILPASSGNGPRIFILSLKAGGTGLNLTAANHVFHFDRWWNPAVENQATDRVFRIGQTRNVQVHKFLCAGTLEEKIDEMIERKKEIAETVVGTGEGWLTELSTRQLKELFALRKEAVGE